MQLVKRAWGHYLVLLNRRNFKVKLLRFRRGGRLSVQKHLFRNELWLFLSGNGQMRVSQELYSTEAHNFIGMGNAINIEKKFWHTFTANIATWIIEVQYGSKCEESDIIRL